MPGDTQNSRDEASNVDDHDLIQALINENVQLRKTLSEVSAVGATMMFHTHRQDCSGFSREFLKAVVQISQALECVEITNIFHDGLEMAASNPAWKKYQATTNL